MAKKKPKKLEWLVDCVKSTDSSSGKRERSSFCLGIREDFLGEMAWDSNLKC